MASFTASPGTWTNNSDANFRAWGSYLSARMAAVGLVQTADTGQINWTTVTAPSGVGVFQGYEIWRFADALQATAPVYIKIEYGEAPASADGPSVRVQFGSGSNGSGTLTGTLSTQVIASCPSVTSSAVVFGSGGTARFCVCGGFTTAGGFGQFFGFERSKDAAGNDTVEAVLWLGSGSATGSTGNKSIMTWSTTIGDLQISASSLVPAIFPLGATAAFGSQVGVSPIMHQKPIFMNPGLNFVGYLTENIAANGTPSVYMYGAAHVYYTLPATSGNSASAWQGPGSGTEALALRYE